MKQRSYNSRDELRAALEKNQSVLRELKTTNLPALHSDIVEIMAERDAARAQVKEFAEIIVSLAAVSDFRTNADGSYRYPDSEAVLGRDEGTLTRGDIRKARVALESTRPLIGRNGKPTNVMAG